MGICYSSIGRKRTTAQKEASLDAKFQKSCSGDFSSFIGKFGGGGGAAADERALLQIPGRLFASGSSKIASLYTQQGKKGTNQDAMIVWEVRDCLPILLASQWEANSNNDRNEDGNATRSTNFEECTDEELCEPLEVEENKKFPEMHQPLKKSMLKAFKLMDKELRFHPIIDCYCSGTTAVTLVKQGQDLIIGNVGDSRAVLATRDKEDALTAEQLTIDLKPNLPREAARIQQYKGRVFALQDEPEVARVWLPNSDSPGLAMARAFGDFCLKDFGLISVPDVYYHQLTEKDEFIVLASDGVWDVLSNKEAVDVVASAPTRATAARALVDCATRAWRLKYPTSKIDDCAVVCLFLEHVPAAAEAEAEAAPAEAAAVSRISVINGDLRSSDNGGISASHVSVTERSTTTLNDSGEIVPVPDSTEEKHPQSGLGQSKRSLAECLSNAEDEEWSALEGITRVNSLLSIPRFLSGDKRSASWRKWL
ncbi:probable protein phosphatase 2C 66 isoform X3 [Diospyros lotus]|uniref:probable protein phosphatase 2C 66 isoform X3 n=1 Tax=Diospyros lotus TaxID=55363 RepID=UPI00225258F4|nr:probable protein phosphatase 2C 66 isoform X3 [Diospyros lotus]